MPRQIRAELHSHTTFSDGTYTPEVLAQMCADAGVSTWSVTDHDTASGCPAAARAAAQHGIEFLTGIEISAFADISIHVLGYGVDPNADVLKAYSDRRLQARHDRMLLMIDKLNELGVNVPMEAVLKHSGEGAIVRPHLARALVDVGAVATMQEAFDNWISNDGAAYVETPWPKVPDAIALIREAGGAAVLAHPGIYDRDHLIAQWVEAGLVGIEAIHPKHGPEEEERYVAMATELGVFNTASSDFHGPEHISADYFGKTTIAEDWLDALRDASSN